MVTYIRSDLDFILAQIKIAEAHAGGQPLFGAGGLIPTYNLSWGLRTVDGTYNNLLHPEWGAADNEFPEHLGTIFRPADGTPVDFDGPGPQPPIPTSPNYNPSTNPNSIVVDTSVRTISNLLVDQTLGNPSAILTGLQIAGIVPPANQMTVTAQISAAYEPLEPLFKAVASAERAFAAASAAASASPGDTALQDAADAAQLVLDGARVALDAADDDLMTLLAANGIELEGANIKILNTAPDEGLSAPFNSWFTLFGQFFDHGLDLVAKGGRGTVAAGRPALRGRQQHQFHGADPRHDRRAWSRRRDGNHHVIPEQAKAVRGQRFPEQPRVHGFQARGFAAPGNDAAFPQKSGL